MAEAIALHQRFKKEILPELQKKLNKSTVAAVPQVTKVVLNVGIGRFKEDKKMVAEIVENMTAIAGQKPILNKSRKAISNFKLRIGMPVGIKVTLRGEKMYNFLNKLINVVFPRIRDFRGFSEKSFDGNGNLSIGIKEHTVFPEVLQVDSTRIHGVQITIHTTATNDADAHELMKLFKFPFRKLTTQ
ncbi:50S ribosomal protein L5 [Candidatus Peregrinibacteria bacterium CG11_big_fil_rev_8_21_14_0_20_41_10]|nr:MAG: 50S ribosomal protein L5 [Candidatus Peregrinibacteria bacterium CG11_big_fil_rev_8_21_14_0_20_41_10]PIZ76770.1 MAG: 50S ribosomal protein L5 [Candidatus Peregrinibacteria bacterium CG_4_10_14_0_2_um_filter_41_8]PJC37973.1 MAG: 50S ribosomal protein L5 [Candidatus Peregrinibacteria bacterium CG_4_9_14_0_2_um_filter_41_14]